MATDGVATTGSQRPVGLQTVQLAYSGAFVYHRSPLLARHLPASLSESTTAKTSDVTEVITIITEQLQLPAFGAWRCVGKERTAAASACPSGATGIHCLREAS